MKNVSSELILGISILVAVIFLAGIVFFAKGEKEPWQVQYARELNLDVDKFKADLEDQAMIDKVETDIAEGQKRGITATPTFFINGAKITFADNPQQELIDKIQAEITATGKPVLLEKFSDFQCPACKAFNDVTNLLRSLYGDQLEYQYRHFPLANFRPLSYDIAIASEAARNQGKFDEFKELVFTNQSNVLRPKFEKEEITNIEDIVNIDETEIVEVSPEIQEEQPVESEPVN
jgi:protein-disulfide isomerase